MIDFHKELIKKFHPDQNNNSKYCTVITKVINKLKRQGKQKELENLYNRLIGRGFLSTR